MSYLYWRTLLVEPKSRNDDRRRREFILNVLLISSIVVSAAALLIVVARFFSLGSSYSGEPPFYAALQVAGFVGLWILSRKGLFVSAAYALVIIFLLIALNVLFQFGIMMPQGLLLLSLVLIMSSILLGTKAAAILTLIASFGLIALGILQQNGVTAFDAAWMKNAGGPVDAIGFSLIFAVITTVSWLSNREIERFNVRLQYEVREATEHLRTANKKLKVLDKAKDEFISMASHQLGTPLTAITGYLSMSLEEDKGNMTVGQREYVNIALESAGRLVNMANDLLNVSRLNAGRFNIVRQPIDLVRLVEEQVKQLQPSAERKGLTLEFTPPPIPLPPIPIDESKTTQVVMNFIDNAIYYTEKGGVHVTLEQTGGQAVLKVVDTGMGVPPEEQVKLFAKFYRADNARAIRPDGTGLGLYLAKRVIEDQGGEIIFESALGHGSTFGFKLPLSPGHSHTST